MDCHGPKWQGAGCLNSLAGLRGGPHEGVEPVEPLVLDAPGQNARANDNPSASAALFRPSTRLVASFIRDPDPIGPTRTAERANARKTSEHEANARASPPAMTTASPCRTCSLDPEMVASR